VEGVPEGNRLEAPGRRARELDRDLDRVGAAGREEHAPGCVGQAPELRRQRLGELDRAFAREAPRRERERVELRLDRADDVRVRVADVVHVVAVEVHVPPTRRVLDPQSSAFTIARHGVETDWLRNAARSRSSSARVGASSERACQAARRPPWLVSLSAGAGLTGPLTCRNAQLRAMGDRHGISARSPGAMAIRPPGRRQP
jgi:hypothetical protein